MNLCWNQCRGGREGIELEKFSVWMLVMAVQVCSGSRLRGKQHPLIPVGVLYAPLPCSSVGSAVPAFPCGISRVGAGTATFTTPVSCPLNSKACTALPCCCKGGVE